MFWSVDFRSSDLNGGSVYLFFRHDLVGFLVLSRKCVCAFVFGGAWQYFHPVTLVTFQLLGCDHINNLFVKQSIIYKVLSIYFLM